MTIFFVKAFESWRHRKRYGSIEAAQEASADFVIPAGYNVDPRAKGYFQKYLAVVQDKLGVDVNEIVPNASFAYDLGADSLDTAELLMYFEEEFDITIPDEDQEKLKDVGQSWGYIQDKILGNTQGR